jgi:hypothetical protein
VSWIVWTGIFILVPALLLILLQQLGQRNSDPDASHIVATITRKAPFWRLLREWWYHILLVARGQVFTRDGDDPPGLSNRGILLSSARRTTREIEVCAFGFDPDEYGRHKEVDAALEQLAHAMGADKAFIRRRV